MDQPRYQPEVSISTEPSVVSGYTNTYYGKAAATESSLIGKNMCNISEIRRSGSALNTHHGLDDHTTRDVSQYVPLDQQHKDSNGNLGSKAAFVLKHMSFSNLGADLDQSSKDYNGTDKDLS